MNSSDRSLDGSRVAVLGAAGFLGSILVDHLLSSGAEVVGIDNLSTGRLLNLTHLESNASFRFVLHDIVESFDVDGPLDAIANLASPASPPEYFRLAIETLRVGSQGTENALKLAHRKEARFLQASTSEVYGDPSVHPQVETYWGNVNPIGPRSVYDEAKRYGEALTMAYRRERGVNTGILRIFNTYGPHMRVDDGRAVPEFFKAALESRPLPVHGDGTQTRSLCFVGDLVEGIGAMLKSDAPGPINLGNSHEVTMNELADAVQRAAGVNVGIVYEGRPVDDPNRRCPDTALAASTLGWSAEMTLDDGLQRTLPWFQSQLDGSSA